MLKPAIRYVAQATLIAATMIAPTVLHAADFDPAKVASAAIRLQGHTCAEPVSAEREPDTAGPADGRSWLVVCSNARYRVRFVGNIRPRIEPLP